jgi:hypothetical protein
MVSEFLILSVNMSATAGGSSPRLDRQRERGHDPARARRRGARVQLARAAGAGFDR